MEGLRLRYMAVVIVVAAAAGWVEGGQTHCNRVTWRGGDRFGGSYLNGRRKKKKKGRRKKSHTSHSLVENNISYERF